MRGILVLGFGMVVVLDLGRGIMWEGSRTSFERAVL